MLQKYPVNNGMRDGLSEDMGVESVQTSSSPPDQKLLPTPLKKAKVIKFSKFKFKNFHTPENRWLSVRKDF